MSDAQLLLPKGQNHNNRQLFSDYYLNLILPQRPQWDWLREEAEPVKAEIAALFQNYVPSENEAQLEHELARPVLQRLGHAFEVQPALKTPDGTKRPNYVFYASEAERDANKDRILTDALPYQGGLGIGDAKHWERSLDMTAKSKSADPFSNKNPSYQIAFYMQHSGVDWGILTNGRCWRLYHRDTAHKLDRYYEVDVPALLASDDNDAFLYFYAFFRRAAFAPGPLSVEAIRQESVDWARGVGDSLKAQVFEALRHLAQGFLDYTPNGLETDTVSLRAIYDNSLIVLYRLLFLLYAEDRGLLPVASSSLYRSRYSLYAIKRRVADDLDSGERLLSGTAGIWQQLKDLFAIIDKGNRPLSVETFNGGLFDPAKHPFLERYAVGDYHVQEAIDRLARVNGHFVDYRDLSVRHLGTIYEGLLEYHLETLTPDSANGDRIPAASGGGAGWTVGLRNDKGDRKATGSYYTPDYIVKYMVEETVGPALMEAIAGKTTDGEKIAAILSVNVLDPAMGSGHFPVEVTEYIARALVDLGLAPDDEGAGEPDLTYWKRRVVQSCIYGVDLNPLAVELAKLSLWLTTAARDRPLSFLDHHLRPGNALVGARLEELQRANRTPAPGKRGRKAAEGNDGGQLALIDAGGLQQNIGFAVGSMEQIEGSASDAASQVKAQEALYTEMRRNLLGKYGRWADLVTAAHFGVEVSSELWTPLADFATGRTISTLPQIARFLDDAETIARRDRFFHWELEFPEIYFDHNGQPLGEQAGFDVVIGNPPYVRQEELTRFKPFYQRRYTSVYHGAADLFVYFFGQALRQLRQGGRTAYISSNSWFRSNYATSLRSLLRTEAVIESLVDLGDNRVFADAPDLYPAIHIVRRELPPQEHTAQAVVFRRGEGIGDFHRQIREKRQPVTIHDQPDLGWQLGDDIGRQLFAKLMACGEPLGTIVGGKLNLGIKTGLNEAFVLDTSARNALVESDPKCAPLLRPICRGEDLRPWYQENEGLWLLGLQYGWTQVEFDATTSEADAWAKLEMRYPSVAAHLKPFEEVARVRTDQGKYWWELRPCDYFDAFAKPKLFWPSIAKFPRFSLNGNGAFVTNSGFFIDTDQCWLLGLLNSRTLWYVVKNLCIVFGERAGIERYQLFIQYVGRFPVPNATGQEREVISGLAMAITEQARARYDLHEKTRRRIASDLGVPGMALNQKLTA